MRERFLSLDNQFYLSTASLWEMGIKVSPGKLRMSEGCMESLHHELSSNELQWLAVEAVQCKTIEGLPFDHRNPFDRMLIAQTNTEKMVLMENEVSVRDYVVFVSEGYEMKSLGSYFA